MVCRWAIFATLLALASGVAGAAPVPAQAYQDLRWRMIGPFRGGRTRAVAGAPGKPAVLYMAQVNGGVWKSDDYGQTWVPIFDKQPTQSIGALAVAPSNPNIVYAGSGEGLHRPDLSVGDGMYRSLDAGKTWLHVGLTDAQQIAELAVDPKNPNRVFAAVMGHPYGPSEQRGIFRTDDGGQTWKRVLFRDANTGGSDVAIDPLHPNIVYAALWEERLGPWEDDNEYEGTHGGLFKSTDGGATWKQLAGGLPANAVQFDIAIAPSRPERLYVTCSTTEKGEYASGKGNGFYRSDDAGATWQAITTDERPRMKIGGGDLMVPVVDPKNPDVVYVASLVTVKSSDGGRTWTWVRGAPGGDDYQNLWVNPADPNVILLVADQGAAVSVNGGRTWSSWYNQPTAQLYHVAASNEVPYRVCSGQQESGSVCIASRGNDGAIGYREWRPVGASEYGYAVPDPRNPDIVWGAGRNHVSRYSYSTGRAQDVTPIPVRGKHRVERTQPIIFSPLAPGTLYYGAEALYATTDGGQTWRAISGDLGHPKPAVPASVGAYAAKDTDEHRGAIYALAPSYKAAGTIWAGTDDGKLWVTRTGGAKWLDVTPPQVTPWTKITQLDASRFDDQTVYASASRLRVDDLAPYIYKTHDGGKTWTAIASNLPPGPVDAVRADPVKQGLLYAATETGVWVSFDDGAAWQSLQQNLPHSAVRDLIVHQGDLVVATHGRGFWIMDAIAPLRQLAPTMADTLFAPPPAYRLPRSLYPDTPIPPDEPMAENPPDGAIIDYLLAAPSPAVAIEISDAKGAVIRRYANTDPPDLTADELARQLIPAYWVRPHRAPLTTAGMHRFVWDLRGERPLAAEYEYPINAVPHDTPRVPEGPLVLPGTYTVKLTANGKTLAAKVEVRGDPRSKLSATALAQQHALELRLAALLTRSAEMLLTARSIKDQLATSKAPKPQRDAVAAALEPLLDNKDKTQPTLESVTGRADGLYKAVQVDALPTAAQLAATAQAEKELAVLAKRFDAFRAELEKRNLDIKPDLRARPTNHGGEE
jgi:photosystem II stability/assembly factor-like uncharacterized protein